MVSHLSPEEASALVENRLPIRDAVTTCPLWMEKVDLRTGIVALTYPIGEEDMLDDNLPEAGLTLYWGNPPLGK